jgi:hypothetical protein
MSRYTSAKTRPSYTFDADLQLKDAGLIAADGAWQVSSANQIIDVGAGRFEGRCIIDVSAIEIASGDERYTHLIMGSTSPTFASGIVILGALPMGDGSTIGTAFGSSGVDVDDVVGRFEVGFCNERNNTYYRYIRGWTDVAGSIATGINFTAFIARY